MHRAWLIDDIWRLIGEQLTPRSLASLAQTCKALFDLATSVLWTKLTSFSPFLSCLGSEYRHLPLEGKHVARLDLYATKVRTLVLETLKISKPIVLPQHFDSQWRQQKKNKHNQGKTWQELWEEVSRLRPQTEFLPNLQRLRVSNVAADYLIPMTGISGHNLKYVCIKYLHGKLSPTLTTRFLSEIQDVSQLNYLFVRDGGNIVPRKVLKQAPLNHLRLDPRVGYGGMFASSTFKTFPLPVEIFEKNTLEHLTLPLSRAWCTPEVREMTQKCFPSLKSLWIHLTTFNPQTCGSCTNTGAHSWTCRKPPSTSPMNNLPVSDCGRRSPVLFFDSLNNPSLQLLNIKFPVDKTTGPMFLDVVSAAQRNCRLSDLVELSFGAGGWFPHCSECEQHPGSQISPSQLRQALKVLLPLPRLRALRLTVAPNFLDVLDLALYEEMADGLQALETLWLGRADFATSTQFHGSTYRERVPLHHIAAFCTLLPSLTEVKLGCVDGMLLDERPHPEWSCFHIKKLTISNWAGNASGRGVSRDLLHLALRTYFPCSDLAAEDFDERLYMFET